MVPIDFLSEFLGNAIRARVLRFAFSHPGEHFSAKEVALRTRMTGPQARKELKALARVGLIRAKEKKGISGYVVPADFRHFDAVARFLEATAPQRREDVLRMLKKIGKVQAALLSGFFVGDEEASLDVLVAGERIDEKKLALSLRALETMLGREIRYASMTTEELKFRIAIKDRLVRDVIERTHEVVIDTEKIFG